MINQPRYLHYIFLFSWLILNLVQSTFTELGHDEAYFWMYSLFPDWGHFHHPPLVGVLTGAGYALFKSELGVRLMSVILSTSTLHFLHGMLVKRNTLLFWAIAFSTLLINAGGFLVAPDVPLIFFTTLFFYFFKRYLEHDHLSGIIALSLIIPLMLYSKYFGILPIVFTLVANVKLIRRKSFWVISCVSILLFLPHVVWHINHDFPGFHFNLVERFGERFNPAIILSYPFEQIAMTGPLIGIITLFSAIKFKPANPFEKTLKYNFAGIFIFLFILTFNGRVEANWTATAFIPLILLSHQYLCGHIKLRRWLYYLAVPGIVLLLTARIHLMQRIAPLDDIINKFGTSNRGSEFHGWKAFAQAIKAEADGRPIMANSYQEASKLSFYTNTIVPSLNVHRRGNEFDIWKFDHQYYGKEVVYVDAYWRKNSVPLVGPGGRKYFLTPLTDFRNYNRASVELLIADLTFEASAKVSLPVRITNPEDVPITADPADPYPTSLSYIIYQQDSVVGWFDIHTPLQSDVVTELEQKMEVQMPEAPGDYRIKVFLNSKDFMAWQKLERHPLKVVESIRQ